MDGILGGVDEIDLRQVVSVDSLLETNPGARLQVHRVFLPHHLLTKGAVTGITRSDGQ